MKIKFKSRWKRNLSNWLRLHFSKFLSKIIYPFYIAVLAGSLGLSFNVYQERIKANQFRYQLMKSNLDTILVHLDQVEYAPYTYTFGWENDQKVSNLFSQMRVFSKTLAESKEIKEYLALSNVLTRKLYAVNEANKKEDEVKKKANKGKKKTPYISSYIPSVFLCGEDQIHCDCKLGSSRVTCDELLPLPQEMRESSNKAKIVIYDEINSLIKPPEYDFWKSMKEIFGWRSSKDHK